MGTKYIAEGASVGRIAGDLFSEIRVAHGAQVDSIGFDAGEARQGGGSDSWDRGPCQIEENARVDVLRWSVDGENRPGLYVGANAVIGLARVRGRLWVGELSQLNPDRKHIDRTRLFDVQIGQRSRVGGTVTLTRAKIGNDVEVVDHVEIHDSTIHDHCKLLNGHDIKVHDSTLGEHVTLAAPRRGTNEYRSGATNIRGAFIDTHAWIGSGVKIDENVMIDGHVVIGEMTEVHKGARVGWNTKIGQECLISRYAIIGSDVTIEDDVHIGDYVNVPDGVTIGRQSRIGAGAVVSGNVEPGSRLARKSLASPDESFFIQATSESWLLNRLADIAEQSGGRLDKRAIQKAHPQLVEHALVKKLLQVSKQSPRATIRGREVEVQAPVTADQLRDLAEQFAGTAKYHVSVILDGWTGIQRITLRTNDVATFDLDDEVVAALAVDEDPALAEHKKRCIIAMMRFGRPDDSEHPGAKNLYNAGWMRFVAFEDRKSLLIEELQTDLLMLSYGLPKEFATVVNMTRGTDYSPLIESAIIASRGITRPMRDDWVAEHPRTANHPEQNNMTLGFWEHRKREILSACTWLCDRHVGSAGISQHEVRFVPVSRAAFTPAQIVAALAAMNCGYLTATFDWYTDNGQRRSSPLWPGDISPSPRSERTGKIDPWVATGLALHYMLHGERGMIPPVVERHLPEQDYRDAIVEGVNMAAWLIETATTLMAMLDDLYEAMLGGALQIARQRGIQEVWLLDYETKYAMAAYSKSVAPPRSVYNELPKHFQVAPVQPLPSWMDPAQYERRRETVSSSSWKQVEPPAQPRGRRLVPNRGRR